ncbi:dihydroorotate dehydrogenase electron transfer subunit [Allobacillus sp. GCM10007491]|uniref:Dihydroorotate dehydrogenase B (NAD(+)), electron transfer subunit n=1 Tax=Allobacillus saliphilus TaxID=2912308 RepID=A0A941CXL2_9BACI|nr:dihydroorotate dehydrogenase electron transfer subunit [Allobacillus saliphilus]MBR7554912.1 dihydroorotate dehydrogenase electron transfer subunit [Allobacillus saliphilus]MBR7555021.1 dihydroorotate dehydrogenase electron transfer subunit [Allobacillus saliphilus]
MINKVNMAILKKKFIAKDTIEFVLKNEFISHHASPGQFLHILIDGLTLRRPVSIADIDKSSNEVTIAFKIVGTGTKKLASYEPGQSIDVLGPLGNGFDISNTHPKKVLLIGGGIGIPPLYHLGKRLSENNVKIISILGYQTKESVFYEREFQELGDTYVVTDDGTHGYQGLVTDVLTKVSSFDTFYTCGPTPMLKAIKERLSNSDGYVSLEERMGCGIGACLACVIPTSDGEGYKKICQDGPVFHAKEVNLS